MALEDDYSIVTQYPDVRVLGGTKYQDVQVVGVLTSAHNVYFEFAQPRKTATTANLRQNARGFTIIYELLFEIPGVADVRWTQVPKAGGLLEDHVIVTVESPSGESSAELNFPYSQFNQDVIAPRVARLRASLAATEGA